MPTNLYTSVSIGDTEYSIKKFDAKTGLKLARMVIAKAAPLIPLLTEGDDGKGKKNGKKPSITEDDRLYSAVGTILNGLSDDDMDMIVDKCLRVCSVKLPAGPQSVIDENGNYGIEGIEYDMALTLRLCFEAIKWGAADFFAENRSLFNLLTK